MQFRNWSVFVAACAVALFTTVCEVVGQEAITDHQLVFAVKPLVEGNPELIQEQSAAGAGLKLWGYSVKSARTGSLGKGFTGVMVGNSPLTTKGTTTTTVYVVPLIFKIEGETFNPTVPDSNCLAGEVPLTVLKNSPMVVATHDFKVNGIDVGKTQYSDAFQRANFWMEVAKNGGTYHNELQYKFLPAITITPGTAHSTLFGNNGCISLYGGIEINWFDSLVKGTLIPRLRAKGVGPTNLAAFMIYNTTMYVQTPSQCCVAGYHGAFGSPVQTYSPFQFDTASAFGTGSEDTAIMAHEINEWQDDPLGTNATPAWGHVGQVTGCQGNLEVGDPLTGHDYPNVTLNGHVYHLQELAFFSWFFGAPSIGAGRVFSDKATFKAPAAACQ